LVGLEFEARRARIGGVQISEGLQKIISTPALVLTGRVYLVENLYSNKGKHVNRTIIF
jgi:hypothetical protein